MTMTKYGRLWKPRPGGACICSLMPLAAAFLCFLSTGCQAPTNVRLGQRAEQRGRYYAAYQYYCDEAEQQPSNRTVQAAIARSAPHAARYYEHQAARAADAGDYADAWKLYMQALTITPDNSAVARLIRMLEEHHPNAIAPAKVVWMKQGAAALAVAPAASPARPHPIPARTAVAAKPHEAPARRTTSSIDTEQDRRSEPADVAAATDVAPRRALDDPSDAVAKGAPASDTHTPPPAPPTGTISKSPQLRNDRTPPPVRSGAAGRPELREAYGAETGGAYLMTAILSVNDWRFPRRTHTVDDIHVRLKDTDRDPDADLDIYMGTKRVRKARDVEPGQGVRVKGRSGKWYEVVVITIVDRTESVRIGIRPHLGTHE